MFSNKFRKNDAGIYLSLVRAGFIFSSQSQELVLQPVGKLFNTAGCLPSSSEGEASSNNTTCAEMFAGLLRALRDSASPIAFSIPLQKCFLDFFLKCTDKVSVEYANQWAEALHFAYLGRSISADNSQDDLLATHLIEGFRSE